MPIRPVIIGDEILSGKRQDKHFNQLQIMLAKRGLELSWTLIVGDDPQQLERALRYSMSSEDLVFSFGGIGATPDDRTRQTVAKIADVPLIPHPEATAEIEARFGEDAYPNRILMGYLPEGSKIIPNTINRIPGFSYANHHFTPGFPEMAWPMVEWVLDNLYAHLKNQRPATEQTIFVLRGRESDLLPVMNQIVNDYPQLKLSSLPHLGDPPHIEFSLRGDLDQIEQAMQLIKQAVDQAGFIWSDQLIQ